MSIGKKLQEMEVSSKKSVTAVNKGAVAAEAMPKINTGIVDGQTGSAEDLGGPTPFNSKSTDDSNKYNFPGKSLKQVKNVVNKGAKAADPMQTLNKSAISYENYEDEESLVDEDDDEDDDDEVTEASCDDKKGYEDNDDEDEDAEDAEDDEDDKKGKKKKKVEESYDKEEFSYNFSDDVNALVGNEDLSESFKEKATLIFETALKNKITEIKETLDHRYAVALEEEVKAISEDLTERVDSYLEYVSTEWLEENSLQVETGIKSELSESFMSGLKSLFEEHYVEIPEGKYNVVEGMVERLDEMEYKLNEQIEKNVQLNKRLSEAVSDTILNDVSEGLALTQKDKLASLAESVGFEGEQDYREKLEILKNSYFARNSNFPRDEVLIEQAYEDHGPQMNAYIDAIRKFSK